MIALFFALALGTSGAPAPATAGTAQEFTEATTGTAAGFTTSHGRLVVGSNGAAAGYGEEMVISADRLNLAPAHRVIDREEVKKIPGSWGDPFRAVQNLPGVARPFLGFFGEIVVRGSAPEDTRLYVDGHEVPLLYHFGGLKSLLNPESIDTVEFLPGGFGAYYGRAIGGVLDAHTRAGVPDRAHVHLQTDLMDTDVFAQVPVHAGWLKEGAITGAVRRSYIDLLIRPVDQQDPLPRYYDYLVKADGVLRDGSNAGLLVFGTDDALVSGTNEGGGGGGDAALLHTIFHRLQGRWKKALPGDRTVSASLAAGIDKGLFQGGVSLKPRWVSSLRADVRTPVTDGLRLNAGADLSATYQNSKNGLFENTGGDGGGPGPDPVFQGGSPREWLFDAGLYAEAEWQPLEKLTLVPGARADWFGEIDKLSADPRLAVRYRLDDSTTLLGATGLYHQPPRIGLLGIFVFDLGALGIDVPAEQAVHAVAGVERIVSGSIGFDVYTYYKWMDHLSEVNLDPTAQGDSNEDIVVLNGKGRAYGAEAMIRLYPTEHLFAWLAYTLSRAERLDPKTGRWYPFSYDQTHNLDVIVSWQLGESVRFGGRARWVTGDPFTPDEGGVYDVDQGSWTPIPGPRASRRVPPFWQLDARLDKFVHGRIWTFDFFADVLNTTNRRNPEFPTYNHDYTQLHYEKGLPILPLLGFEAQR